VSVGLALAGITCFVIAHAVSTQKPTQPAPPVAAARPDAPPVVAALPPPEPANPAPPAEHVAEAKVPEHRKVHRSAHERRGAHERKEHRSHASRGKHGREVALQTPAAPEDDSAARTAYGKGNRLLLTGDTGGAIAAYEDATRLAPSSPAGYRGLGLAYEKQGKSAQAARAFRTYLKLAPGADDRALIAERLQRLAPQHRSGKRAR
jgi:tetratricopeptide (TPR) repeat protein